MSHLVLRLGHLFHLHDSARGAPATSKPAPDTVVADRPAPAPAPAPTVARGKAPPCDDLAFFSLSVERPARDPRADLDRLGLIGLGDWGLPDID